MKNIYQNARPVAVRAARGPQRNLSARAFLSTLTSRVEAYGIAQPSSKPSVILTPTLRSTPARRYSAKKSEQDLRKTSLYNLHLEHGAKMVPFGGFSMPVQYEDLSVRDSHLWTRSKASIFDVGHMVQHRFAGPGAQGLLSRITPAGLAGLPNHHSTLSVLLHPVSGGIVDDTIITRLGPATFYVVTNAGCRDKDTQYLRKQIDEWHAEGNPAVDWEVLENFGLVALQGPLAPEILAPLLADSNTVAEGAESLRTLYFGQSTFTTLRLANGETTGPVLVSRGGYTGEDGFEMSIGATETPDVVRALLESAGPERLRLAGLGARDSLRLEAGMCLYGHDLDDTTTPVEGGLGWVVAKERRADGGFHGAEVVLRQLTPKKDGGTGTAQRRVGFVTEGPPAREGAEIVDGNGEVLGRITSGCPSPSLGKNVAMGYVKTGFQKSGTEVQVVVRGKKHKATVTKMPFVPSKYWKGGASPG